MGKKTKEEEEEMNNCPQNIIESLNRYVTVRIPTGGFLRAVLENDLMEALGRADSQNKAELSAICNYVYNELPMNCWGSRERVRKWLENKENEDENHK